MTQKSTFVFLKFLMNQVKRFYKLQRREKMLIGSGALPRWYARSGILLNAPFFHFSFFKISSWETQGNHKFTSYFFVPTAESTNPLSNSSKNSQQYSDILLTMIHNLKYLQHNIIIFFKCLLPTVTKLKKISLQKWGLFLILMS